MTYPAIQNTGSDDLPPVCFVDSDAAYSTYGATRYSSTGPCPRCGNPVGQPLFYNPQDGGHYYFQCPICLYMCRYLNPDGSLSDMKEVSISRTTDLDIDSDVPSHEGWM